VRNAQIPRPTAGSHGPYGIAGRDYDRPTMSSKPGGHPIPEVGSTPQAAGTAPMSPTDAAGSLAQPHAETHTANDGRPLLVAHVVGDTRGWTIEPASPRRQWMDDFANGFAYRCLPLVMANQAGWVIRSPAAFEAVWSGQPSQHAMTVTMDKGYESYAGHISSHFGNGILTFSIPWLFRTPSGLGLMVRGPTNSFKFNAAPLDGFVETDWAPFTFTMNWKIIKPQIPVRFERNEPICLIHPFDPRLMESLRAVQAPISSDPGLEMHYRAWAKSRHAFNDNKERKASDWQKNYIRGQHTDGTFTTGDHRTNLKVPKFEQGA